MRNLTVGELKKALEGVPDCFDVKLWSDSCLDDLIVEDAYQIGRNAEFIIDANINTED